MIARLCGVSLRALVSLRLSFVNRIRLHLSLYLKDPVLLLDVSDYVLLLLFNPARERHENELPWLKYVHERDSTRRSVEP